MTAPDPHSEWPISVDIDVSDEQYPLILSCSSWAAARKYLGSAEFKKMADRVERVTITNRDAS